MATEKSSTHSTESGAGLVVRRQTLPSPAEPGAGLALKSDLASWLSKAETAQCLGVSERTLDRMMANRTAPEFKHRPRPGKKPEIVFNPEDVTRMTAAAETAVLASGSTLVPQSSESGGHLPAGMQVLLSLVSQVAEIAQRSRAESPSPFPALWLTLDQAHEYSGLSKALLRRLIHEGKLPGLKDGGWKVARTHLDYLANHALDLAAGNASLAKLTKSQGGE